MIAVLELRIGVETEAAALAAQRRTDANLATMRQALNAVARRGRRPGCVAADFQFHLEIARATQNSHFTELMSTLGSMIIPRARLQSSDDQSDERRQYLRRVNGEHENILTPSWDQARPRRRPRSHMRTHLANSRERRRRAQAEAS